MVLVIERGVKPIESPPKIYLILYVPVPDRKFSARRKRAPYGGRMQCPRISRQFHRFTFACVIATILCANLTHAASDDSPPGVSVVAPAIDAIIGKSLTLSVNADGAHPLRYCWRKDGQILAGQTGSQLKINNVLPSTAGAYAVEVANDHGTTMSEVINVRVCAPGLRLYWHTHGLKLTFKARRCVRYAIECTGSLPPETAWNVFAMIDRNGTIRLTDRTVPLHLLCVFRIKAEADCQCDREHDDGEGEDLEVTLPFGTSTEG